MFFCEKYQQKFKFYIDIFQCGKYNTKQNKLKNKPMIKSSTSGIDLTESCRWWECGRKNRSEWTYEGRRTAGGSRIYFTA